MCVDDLFSFFLEFHHSSRLYSSKEEENRGEVEERSKKKNENANEPVLWGPSYRTVVNIYVYI